MSTTRTVPSPVENPTISEDIALFFENAGLLTRIEGNKRWVAQALILSTPAPRPQLAAGASSHISPLRHGVSALEIPATLNSLETFSFIGFDNETAAALWDEYKNNYISFINIATYHVVGAHVPGMEIPGRESSEVHYRRRMEILGINNELCEAILDPAFIDFRETQSCTYWLLESITTKYEALKAMNGTLAAAMTRFERQRAKLTSIRETTTSARSTRLP
ncbi:MAG: hypothetical protein M1839_002116 [Geoglossum umbratile]|nr:MAG: hypothetical protein M1839_002116 [Geoglossum umbratile]